jgi:hypothetical protein
VVNSEISLASLLCGAFLVTGVGNNDARSQGVRQTIGSQERIRGKVLFDGKAAKRFLVVLESDR